MIKIAQPSVRPTTSDSVTFFPHDEGWVARVQVSLDTTPDDTVLVSWYQVMDEDELDDMLQGLCEQSIDEQDVEPEDDDVDPVEDKLQSMFEKGVGDGR